MNKFINNISEYRRALLTKVEYSLNESKNLSEKIELQAEDVFSVLNESTSGFSMEFSRKISSVDKTTGFNIEVSYEVDFKYIEPVSEDEIHISRDKLLESVKENTDFFTSDCMAKASIIISQISAFILSGAECLIMTPPHLVVD